MKAIVQLLKVSTGFLVITIPSMVELYKDTIELLEI